jgi:dynamin-binding protein
MPVPTQRGAPRTRSGIQGLDDLSGRPSVRPRSPLVHTPPAEPSKSPPLPPRSPLRPQAFPRAPSKDVPAQDMPHPMLRTSSSSSFSINTLIDALPPTNIIIDGAFLGDKSKHPPLLSVPRTPSPDKPLPITPLSTSSPTLVDDTPFESPRLRDPLASPSSSATIPCKALTNGTSKRSHALIELIESERAYASDLALIRDIHLPVALGMCHFYFSPHTRYF